MAKILSLSTFTDKRGNLTVVERVLPFDIKRVFYIYGVDNSERGFHRHKKTVQAAVSIVGSCKIKSQSNENSEVEEFMLDNPAKCLLIQPEDYHWMYDFSEDCILMVFASEHYDYNDYILESYNSAHT